MAYWLCPFSHHQQGRIDFNTVDLSLSTGEHFLIQFPVEILMTSLGALPGPYFEVVALRAGFGPFTPFGRSGRVTHATVQ